MEDQICRYPCRRGTGGGDSGRLSCHKHREALTPDPAANRIEGQVRGPGHGGKRVLPWCTDISPRFCHPVGSERLFRSCSATIFTCGAGHPKRI